MERIKKIKEYINLNGEVENMSKVVYFKKGTFLDDNVALISAICFNDQVLIRTSTPDGENEHKNLEYCPTSIQDMVIASICQLRTPKRIYCVRMSEEVFDAIRNLLYEEKYSSSAWGDNPEDVVQLGGTELVREHEVLSNYEILNNLTIETI